MKHQASKASCRRFMGWHPPGWSRLAAATRLTCCALMLAGLLAGCRCSREDTPQQRRAAPLPASSASREEKPLLDQVFRAEQRQGGLVMDMGTPDQHKYMRGGWKSGWGKSGRAGDVSYTELSREGVISYHDWEATAYTLTIMARAAAPGQQLGAMLNGRKLGSREVPTSWGVLEFSRVSHKKPGRRTLYLLPRTAGGGVQVQWIWLRTGTGAGARPDTRRVANHTLGETRRALVAQRTTTYSFYLPVPPRAELLMEYGSRQPGRLEVTARADGQAPMRLLSADTAGGRWRPARLDLAPLAGKVIRLDLALISKGGADKDLGAGLARPRLVWPISSMKVPSITAANRVQNLIHVVVDAARQDAYRAFNPAAKARTPVVSALAKEGVIFTNAQVNASHTVASVSSMISGRYPHTFLGSERHQTMGDDIPILAMHLRGHGVASALITANPFLSKTFGFHRRQDHFRNYPMEGQKKWTRQMFADALAWIKKQQESGKRFYLYIQTMDPHHPYRFHKAHTPRHLGAGFEGKTEGVKGPTSRGTPAQQRYARALYTGEIEAHDVELGRFWAGLKSLGVLKRTLVVYSSDHGEELFERGRNDHGHSLHEELLRTPLVMHYPALLPGGHTVRHPVEMVDLVPTIIEMMGLPHMPGIQGRSMLSTIFGAPPQEPDYLIAELSGVALRLGHIKLIQKATHRLLFNLGTDAGEQIDLSGKWPVAGRACDVRLGEAMASPSKGARLGGMGRWTLPPAAAAPVIPPHLRKQLEALGYIQ